MWFQTYASRTLRSFADERRRVVSDWRIWIVARRIARAENALLPDEKKAWAIVEHLIRQASLKSVAGISGVYIVDTPYANLLEVSHEQIIQEANPWAVFAFLTAMAYHGLTDIVPKEIFVTSLDEGDLTHRIPLGTTPEDWVDLKFREALHPRKVENVSVRWTTQRTTADFGVMVGHSCGMPIYVTDVERTLLDALRMPDKSGGIIKVLQAWRSSDQMNINTLVDYTDRCDNMILRQRVGYVLEQLGRTHPRLKDWQRDLQRGGSVKLVANKPYSPNYSAEWNLSLNVPDTALALLQPE